MRIPYSDNIIFMDTEFTTLDPEKGQLISIALVKQNDEELYIEFEYDERAAEIWVRENVIPTLKEEKLTKEAARRKIIKFIGKHEKDEDKPFLVAYINQFDAIYWYKLFGSAKEHPAYWVPIDFAAILFGYGYKPNSFGNSKFLKELGIEKEEYKEHHALEDARMLKNVYNAFFKKVIKSSTSFMEQNLAQF